MKVCVVALAAGLAACTSLGEDSIFEGLPDGSVQPTLTSLNETVFLPLCSCHRLDPPSGGLDMRTAMLPDSLVDVPSQCAGVTMDRVEPGDPDNSFLAVKLAAHTEGGAVMCGDPMPQVGSGITQAQLDAVRQWISDGALP